MMLSVSLPFALLALRQIDSYGPPPGMVNIPQKAIEVGGDPKEIEELIRKDQTVATNLAAELGRKTQAVPSHYLSVFEATNEQYLRFVNATGHRPPLHWGQAAIDEAKRAHVEANAANKSATPFSDKDWWHANWRNADWSMPTDLAAHPVVYVDYYDAEAYCQWAGLRLMTEFEFQAAGRETARQRYTWGDDWKRGLAVSSDPDRRAAPSPIGAIPDSASLHGVFDLCGNVWEWTSSPFVALPGYKALTIKIKQGAKNIDFTAEAAFDSSKRVVVGGSFANTQMAVRLSTRRPTTRDDMFSGLGFRPAADLGVGRGRAAAIKAKLSFDLRAEVELDATMPLGLERWILGEGRIERENYAVIEGHEWLLWIPAASVKESTSSGLRNASREKPIGFGVFTTTVPIADPALEPGTYMLAWRTDGEPKRQRAKPEEQPRGGARSEDAPPVGGVDQDEPKPKAEEDPFGGLVNYDKPALLIYDTKMTLVASIVVGTPDLRAPSRVDPDGRLVILPAGKDVESRENTRVADSLELLRFSTFVRDSGSQGRGFLLEFDFGITPGTIDATWRR